MQLFPDEKRILMSDDDEVILTNQRIYMKDKEWGHCYTVSIFLEDISSIESKYRSHIILLILGVMTILYTLSTENEQYALFSIVFFLAWWFTRKHLIIVTPNGGTPLTLIADGMPEQRITDFVHKVSLAKSRRVAEVYNRKGI